MKKTLVVLGAVAMMAKALTSHLSWAKARLR